MKTFSIHIHIVYLQGASTDTKYFCLNDSNFSNIKSYTHAREKKTKAIREINVVYPQHNHKHKQNTVRCFI